LWRSPRLHRVGRVSSTYDTTSCPAALARILIAGFFILLAQVTVAEEIAGRVTGIIDGDTLTLSTERHAQVRIQLAEIDTGARPALR
jgi:endonuclease YncB( thermonuclease family)